MPTEKQIAAQKKRELIQIKKDTVSRVIESILHVLHDSQFFGSNLWPTNGFKTGYSGTEELDTICILILMEGEYKKVRFNLWGKEERVHIQYQQLVAIFDQAIYDNIYFYPEYPEYIDTLSAHYHDGFIMGMLNFKFTINPIASSPIT